MLYSEQNRNRCKRLFRRAFTLVEIMVAIILTTIVLTSAYMIWSRIQIRISRSYTKQTLQKELRTVANFMQNDFKSIKFHDKADKNDKDSDKAVDIKGDDKNFTMTFQKFKEAEEADKNKLAQDIVEDVKYTLASNVLTRTCGSRAKVLSFHCEGVNITPAAGENSKSDDYANASQEVKDAKEAQLDIEITGKMTVPGSGEEMFHVEKTSVVMRNEYYKKINKNYKSNFDLAKEDENKIVGEGAAGALSGEDMDYSQLDTEVLENLKTSEEEVLKGLEDNLKEINKTLNDTNADIGVFGWLGSYAGKLFLGKDDDYQLFNDSKAKLKNAKTVAETEAAIKTIKERTEKQEEGFYSKAYTKKSFSDMSKDEQATFRKAYDMAIQQRTIDKAYEEAEEKPDKKPTSNISLQKELIEEYEKQDSNSATAITKEQYEEAKKVVAVYNDIKLDWMKDDDDSIKVYTANKQLMEQANTKLELLKSKEKTEKNLEDIQNELNTRS